MKEYQLYTNKDLLLLLSQNDQQAFAELYQRYWQKLFALAVNRLKCTAAAEDVVQDVMLSLWKGRLHLKIEQLENYLASATKYCVLAKVKSMQKDRGISLILSQQNLVTDSSENALHYKKILEIIKKEVETLPQRCKLIFKYSREEGMATKEIAQLLQLSPKTVENQLTKALKHLRVATRTLLHSLVFFVF